MTKKSTSKIQKYRTSSGLGGSFTVVIVEQDKNDADRVKVRCTNPGWTTYSFWRNLQDLTKIN